MKLKQVKIKNFRRFTNLTVDDIPETAKLIMLAGPNGCGKSSFLDALHSWHRCLSLGQQVWDSEYLSKGNLRLAHGQVDPDSVKVEFHGHVPAASPKHFYIRSAYRNEPEFLTQQLNRTGDPLREAPVPRMIDNDVSVSRNYQKLASQGIEDLYEIENEGTTFGEYRKKSIGDIQSALEELFSDLKLNSLASPLKNGTFRFSKGTSKGFLYKNLSGGEKAAFDLILDLVIARRVYNDTVFGIDEPEAHMNTRLQAKLLKVLYGLIPDNCQLILATHSIGMMRQAIDIESSFPVSVSFLDFGDPDFDQPQKIKPAKPNRTFWKKIYEVALDDLAQLVAPSTVVICEGEPSSRISAENYCHDARCYECIFEDEFPDTQFVSMGNAHEVSKDKHGLAANLQRIIPNVQIIRLIDRDDRSETEVSDLADGGVRVLSRRNLETYLFDDEVLRTLAKKYGTEIEADRLLMKKREIIDVRPGSRDNLKHVSGEIYKACKDILGLTQCGNDAKSFMRDTLAPFVNSEMNVYKILRKDIFGE